MKSLGSSTDSWGTPHINLPIDEFSSSPWQLPSVAKIGTKQTFWVRGVILFVSHFSKHQFKNNFSTHNFRTGRSPKALNLLLDLTLGLIGYPLWPSTFFWFQTGDPLQWVSTGCSIWWNFKCSNRAVSGFYEIFQSDATVEKNYRFWEFYWSWLYVLEVKFGKNKILVRLFLKIFGKIFLERFFFDFRVFTLFCKSWFFFVLNALLKLLFLY
jgi:hypothetical protein